MIEIKKLEYYISGLFKNNTIHKTRVNEILLKNDERIFDNIEFIIGVKDKNNIYVF